MNDDSNKRMRIGLAVAASIAVALLTWFWASTHLPFPPLFLIKPRPPAGPIFGDIELYYILKTVFSTLNATLLVFLLALYAEIYIKRKLEFTLWLIIFCSVLLLNALTSNPILQWAFGFFPFGLGPFAMLPDVFTFVALAILLYLTMKY
jgi:hypothetical protein